MVDVHTKEQRSYNMSRIRGQNTKPELKLKSLLRKRGFIYQSKEYGKPDFIDYRKKIVFFIDGCFWHKCPECFKLPDTNKNFWRKKTDDNLRRDREINFAYQNSGWNVVRIWEHQLKKENFINNNILNRI